MLFMETKSPNFEEYNESSAYHFNGKSDCTAVKTNSSFCFPQIGLVGYKKRTRLSTSSFFASKEVGLAPLLLDACFLASEATEIVEASAANLADAINNYLLDERRVHREDTLNTDAARDLADGESLTCALTLDLDDDTLVDLNTLLVTLLNLVGDRNGVTRLESWQLDAGLKSVLSNFD